MAKKPIDMSLLTDIGSSAEKENQLGNIGSKSSVSRETNKGEKNTKGSDNNKDTNKVSSIESSSDNNWINSVHQREGSNENTRITVAINSTLSNKLDNVLDVYTHKTNRKSSKINILNNLIMDWLAANSDDLNKDYNEMMSKNKF